MPTPAEFEAIVRQHQTMVFRTLARLVRNREHLEDLAQEVFLRLYRGMVHFRGDAGLSTYLYRIILNVARDEWKRQSLERNSRSLSDAEAGWEDRLASSLPNAERIAGGRELRDHLERALAELTPVEREVVILFHQEECTYEQISTVLNLPLGTVRTHLHRGRRKLRERMQERIGLCTTPK